MARFAMPLNVMDAHYRSFEKWSAQICEAQHRRARHEEHGEWGNPAIKTVTSIGSLHYALNLPTSVVITGIDSLKILHQAFQAFRTFHALSQEEVSALLKSSVVSHV